MKQGREEGKKFQKRKREKKDQPTGLEGIYGAPHISGNGEKKKIRGMGY